MCSRIYKKIIYLQFIFYIITRYCVRRVLNSSLLSSKKFFKNFSSWQIKSPLFSRGLIFNTSIIIYFYLKKVKSIYFIYYIYIVQRINIRAIIIIQYFLLNYINDKIRKDVTTIIYLTNKKHLETNLSVFYNYSFYNPPRLNKNRYINYLLLYNTFFYHYCLLKIL